MTPPQKEYRQMSVNADPDKNRRLTDRDRIENLEQDVTAIAESINELVRQNNRYTDYIDQHIGKDRESHEFWLDIRSKLIVSGAWGTTMLVAYALWYAFKTYVRAK